MVLHTLSLFRSVKENTASLVAAEEWCDVVTTFQTEAGKSKPTKESSQLFSPARFKGERRSKANVIEASLIVLDVDHRATIASVVEKISITFKLAALVYSTASSRTDEERFRVLIPLVAAVDPEAYTATWRAINRAFGDIADETKRGAESLFYLPGEYPDATNSFEVFEGITLAAADWISIFAAGGEQPQRETPSVATISEPVTDLVNSDWETEYLSLCRGNHYRGLFTFMVKVAMSAIARGHDISPAQLAGFARDLDEKDGGWYPKRKLVPEAHNAIAFAEAHASVRKQAEPKKTPGETKLSDFMDEDRKSSVLARLPEPEPPLGKCWIAGIAPYDFSDQVFFQQHNEPFKFLANRCVATASGYYVKEAIGWVRQPSDMSAKRALFNAYAGNHDAFVLDKHMIKRFFEVDGGIVMFQGETIAPGMPHFVTYRGQRLINTYTDKRLPPDTECVTQADCILRLINETLCDQPAASIEAIFESATRRKATLIKWVLHWFAAVYQRPGYHIGTALWLIGALQGVGKGTLVDIMRQLIGPEWVAKADSTEIARGWNTFLSGSLLIEADEFESGSRIELNKLLKSWIANTEVTIATRYTGTSVQPIIANWLLSTNTHMPISIEKSDRRHTFIGVKGNSRLAVHAKAFWSLSDADREKALKGFAAFLSAIEIDEELIRRPFLTEKRAELLQLATGPVERWFSATDRTWKVGDVLSSGDAWDKFREWAAINDPRCSIATNISFGIRFAALEAEGWIEKHRSMYQKARYYHEENADWFNSIERPLMA